MRCRSGWGLVSVMCVETCVVVLFDTFEAHSIGTFGIMEMFVILFVENYKWTLFD